MLKVTRSGLQPYGVAVLTVAIALLLTHLFQPLLQPTVFILFFPAATGSALYGGMRSGLLASILSILVCKYFFIAPIYSLTIADWGTGVRLLVFLLVTLLMTAISSALRKARRRTEVSMLKLRASEERYRVLAENVPQLVWITRADGFVEYFNQRWFDYTGLTPDETLGWEWQRVVHPDDLLSTLEQWRTGLAVGNAVEIQYRLKRADGSYRWHIARTLPIRHPNGEIANWFGTGTDIHDQKQAEETLRQSQERLEFLANASRLLVTSLDYETTLANVACLAVPYLADICVVDLVDEHQVPHRVAGAHIDPAKEELLYELVRRYPPLLNKASPLNKVLRSNQSILLPEIPEALVADYAREAEHRKILQDIGTLCSSIVVPLIARGRSLGGISFYTLQESGRHYNAADLALAEDLAQRVALAVDNARLYRETQEAEQALRQSESRFRRVVESNMIGIGVWELNGKIIEANDALLQLLGFTQEDLQAGILSWQGLTPSEYQPLEEKALQEIETVGIFTPFEKEYIRKDGSRIPVLLGGARFEDMPSSGVFFVLDLTERRRTEQERLHLLEELESKQRLLEAVLQQMPAGIMVAEAPSGRFVLMNEQVQQILRGSFPFVEEVEDYIQYPLFYPDGRLYAPEETPLARSLLTGEVVKEEELDIVCGDGIRRTLLTNSTPIRDAEGQIVAAVLTFYDITDRKQVEKVMQDTLQRLNFHVENTPLAVIERDCDFRITRWSQEAEKIFGWKAEEVIGKGSQEWQSIFEEDIEVVHNARNRLLTGKETQNSCRNRSYTKDGSVVHCEWYNSALMDESGNLVSILSLVLDVTERARAEEALRNSQERLKLAQKVGNIGSCEWNLQTGELIWTEELEALYGLAPGSFGGNYENWVKAIHPDDKAKVEREAMRAVAEGTEFDSEFRILWPDGSMHWIAGKGQTFNDHAGKPWRIIGVNMDITERKQAEQERMNLLERERAARAQAEDANRIKDEFLAVLSHELRSPLNPILGWSKLLQSRNYDAAMITRGLQIIERNAKLQTQLIEDLLDVSRILRGKLSLTTCPIDLVSTTEAALETVRLAASAKSIEIHTKYEPNVGQVLGDSGRLQQIIWNLLSNAIKFTPNGGRVDIRLSKTCILKESHNPKSNYAQIQVIDTGKGINPSFLPYVFDYFRQENSSTTRAFGGLGLGLAIVRHLVELHGGTVRAESPGEGQGATFSVLLPMLNTDSPTQSDNPTYDDAPDLSGIQVLVVDDEPDMREFLAFVLEDYGAQVQVVTSALEALDVLPQVKPDIVLSDIGMPEVDGYALIRTIRAMPPEQGGQIPAIALTAYAGEADQTQALAAGFQKHVAKPVEPDKLAAIVASLADGK